MERNTGHIDEGTLHAWLDGALSPDESARVEAHIASCAACSAAAAEARGLVAAASRILTALDDVPGGVAPRRRGVERRHRLWTGWPLRAAAAVLFVVAGSLAVLQQMGTERRALVTPSAPSTSPVPAATPPAPPVAEKLQVARKKHAAAPPAAPQPAPAAAAPEADEARVVPQSDSIAKAVDRPVTIAGRVVEAKTGQPVPQAQVNLSNPRVSTVTDSTGGYAMAIPASQAANSPSRLDVRRIGYEHAVDSVTVARETASGDTVRRDFALQQATMSLSQVVVAGSARKEAPAPAPAAAAGVAGGVARGAAVNGLAHRTRTPHAPDGCYAIDAAGLPGQIDLPSLGTPPADSARFRSRFWRLVAPDSMAIVFIDTSGVTQRITVQLGDSVLRGQVTRSDSSAAKPFVATRTGARCP
jgi:anti-sigma factor RsiW